MTTLAARRLIVLYAAFVVLVDLSSPNAAGRARSTDPETSHAGRRVSRETVHRGRCYSCGDEWTELTPVAICPECHSTNVAEIATTSPTREQRREFAEAHAEGLHDGAPREFCPECER